jgi:hypothetical protein
MVAAAGFLVDFDLVGLVLALAMRLSSHALLSSDN